MALPMKQFILWTIGITVLGLCLMEPGFALWSKLLPSMRLGSIPIGTDSPLYMLDMTFGLALVAISEEVIFRGLTFTALKKRSYSIPKIFLISAIIFGLIHWSQGPCRRGNSNHRVRPHGLHVLNKINIPDH